MPLGTTAPEITVPIGLSAPLLPVRFAHCVLHFERTLHNESQLARVYLHAWQVTGEGLSRTITEEILNYTVRQMLDPQGGSSSTQDADSEGEEGKFFVWMPEDLRQYALEKPNPRPGIWLLNVEMGELQEVVTPGQWPAWLP